MDRMPEAHTPNLWGITCYFNPVGYQRRLNNYHLFRKRLNVPLVTVELSFTDEFQLGPEDADVLIQLRTTSVLWQKERLLNVALKSLPDTCDKVAWLDCDVLFENEDWVERADRALDEYELVHLFHERHELPKDFTVENPDSWRGTFTSESVVSQLVSGELTAEEVATPGGLLKRSTCGLAWACRRETLDKHGLYDACIIGSGDKAVLAAGVGVPSHFAQVVGMNDLRTKHYLAWAEPFFDSIRGRVGYLPGRLFHLWHGELKDRGHQTRHSQFAQFDFDPYTDVALDSHGCWRWSSDRSAMQAWVKEYFELRNEDGLPPPQKDS